MIRFLSPHHHPECHPPLKRSRPPVRLFDVPVVVSNSAEADQCDLCLLSGSGSGAGGRGGGKPFLHGRLSPLGHPWYPNKNSSSSNSSKNHDFRFGGIGRMDSNSSMSGIGRGVGGGGGGRERILSSREANLWSKLVELKELTAREPSACFPPGLGEFLFTKHSTCGQQDMVSVDMLRNILWKSLENRGRVG